MATHHPTRVRSDFNHTTPTNNSTTTFTGSDPENLLRDDWEETNYVAPSVHRAKADAAQKKINQGLASFWHVDLHQTGPGVFLYFQLLERNMLFFLVSSILVLPSIGLMYWTQQNKNKSSMGQQLLDDPLKFSQLSLGSLDGNTTVVWVGLTLEPPVIGMIIAMVDLSVVFLYILVMLYLYGNDIANTTEDNGTGNDRNVKLRDYAVYITGLPSDVHTSDVQAFFNQRYQLEKPDWAFAGYCGCLKILSRTHRLPTEHHDRGVIMTVDHQHVEGEEGEMEDPDQPVLVTSNPCFEPVDPTSTHNPFASQRSNESPSSSSSCWVAETTLIRQDGDLLRHFMSMKTIVKKSIIKRAKIKHYMHAKKEGEQEVTNATKAVAACRTNTTSSKKTIHKLQHILVQAQKRLNTATKKLLQEKMNYETDEEQIHEKVEWFNARQNIIEARPVVGAFVVFNNEQSRARCLLDYAGSNQWLWKWLQVPPLRYPHASSTNRNASKNVPNQAKDAPPHLELHRLTVTPAVNPSDVVWENHGENACNICCRRALTMFVSLILIVAAAVLSRQYVHLKGILFPTNLPSYSDCQSFGSSSNAEWLAQCTNVSSSIHVLNTSLAAAAGGGAANATIDYARVEQICTQCYCMELTVDALSKPDSNVWQGVQSLAATTKCHTFAVTYGMSQFIAVVAACIVVSVNSILRIVLRCMSNFERYTSLTKQQAKLAFNLFIVQTLNTAVIVVLVNTKLSTVDDTTGETEYPSWTLPFRQLGFLDGGMHDITPSWFANVGTPIMFTLLLNIAGPHAMPLLKALVIQPCQRQCGNRCCGTPNRQEELNARYVGKAFDVTARYATIMTNMCIILLYCGGVPLLLPVGLLGK